MANVMLTNFQQMITNEWTNAWTAQNRKPPEANF